MEKFKKSVRLKNRILKIILSSVIGLSMAVFSFIPFSADEVVYLNYDFDPFQFSQNSNTKASYGYSNNTDMYLSPFSDSVPAQYVTSLPYRSSGYFDFTFGSVFFDGVVYNNQGLSVNDRFIVTFDLGFEYYFDDFSLNLYLVLNSPYVSFDGFYLDEDDQIISLTVDSVQEYSGRFSDIDHSILSQNYLDYVSNYKYFKNAAGNTVLAYFTTYTFYVYKLSVSKSNLNKGLIKNFTININFNTSYNNIDGPRILPYFYFGHQTVNGFIKSSQDSVYTQQLALAQQQNQMLEEITGDPDPAIQNEIDQAQSEQEQVLQELQENVDTINQPTMPPEAELPTAPLDPEEAEEVYEDINTVFNLDGLNLFNILVPTGCVGFLIFTVMRRF